MASLSSSASSSSASTPTASTAAAASSANSNSNNANSTNNNGASSTANNQFYRLKVEDALSYLDQVKYQFERQPEVYNQFLDIMKEFKSQSIDTPGVISRVSNLFRGHTDLIEGFNTFLPPGYKIEVQANNSVHFREPNSNISTLVQPISSLPNQPNTNSNVIVAADTTRQSSTPVTATLVNLSSGNMNAKTNEPAKNTDTFVINQYSISNGNTNNSNGFKNVQQHTTSSSSNNNNSNNNSSSQVSLKLIPTPPPPPSQANNTVQLVQPVFSSKAATTPPPSSLVLPAAIAPAVAPQQSQVEFGHAINYVNKIKSRFTNQPEIYKSFLEILHTYQKQQKNLKEGLPPSSQNFLSESEVYEKVAKLFKNQEDLLQEFSQFLPDANSGGNSLVNTNTNNSTNNNNSSKISAQLQNQSNNNNNINNNNNNNTSEQQLSNVLSNFQNQNFLANQQNFLTNSILNVPIPAVLTSSSSSSSINNLTNTGGPSSNASSSSSTISKSVAANLISSAGSASSTKSQPNQKNSVQPPPASASPSAVSTSSSTSSISSTNTKNNKFISENIQTQQSSTSQQQQQQQQQQPMATINQNSLQCKTNTPISSGSANLTSVKRSSNYQQMSNKKQKLTTTVANSTASAASNSNPPATATSNSSNLKGQTNSKPSEGVSEVSSINRNSGSLNEITFFERLKKALRNKEVYENFLKCLSLFNEDIVSHTELIGLVEPFLSKFANLFKWFKEYVETKSIVNVSESASSPKQSQNLKPNSQLNSNKNRIYLPPGNHFSLEIDYQQCKQYGASYRDISSYPQPISSGQTPLCKSVLNSMYVSFPLWSEDTTYVGIKKNQYEELIFRIEDERFELDVVLESNLCTIRVLENIVAKLSQMTDDQKSAFRLDDTLGGTSETVHIKAIQRVYGDKAKDFIDGLKRNPAVAVPLVLKRLKAKDDEWREAKKNLEKQWREQIERNYLKSLDHCAIPFKQNDQKHLKAKSLTNEIETIYYERQKAKEDAAADAYPVVLAGSVTANDGSSKRPLTSLATNSGPNLPQALAERNPHLVIKYEEKSNADDESILEDAAALIIHHVKRQQSIQKEDKNKMKQIMKHFIPDFFFVARGCLSDDEAEPTQSKQNVQASSQADTKMNCDEIMEETASKKLRSSVIKANAEVAASLESNKKSAAISNSNDSKKSNQQTLEYDAPDDIYRLFFVDDHWYLFFRYHHILCERLSKIYKHSLQITEQEKIDSKTRDKSVAESLKLKNKSEVAPGEYYKKFLDIVRNLLDLNMEATQYEDTLREMFGINAYIAFTLDKVVHNCVRQLQYLVQDEISSSVRSTYLDEQRASSLSSSAGGGCGGRVASMYSTSVINAEMAYQKKSESLLSEQNCFQIISYKNSNRLTIELLDTQEDDDEDGKDVAEIEKWSEYLEKHFNNNNNNNNENGVTNELKEALLKKPVFLTRNAHCLKIKSEKHLSKLQNNNNNTESKSTPLVSVQQDEQQQSSDQKETYDTAQAGKKKGPELFWLKEETPYKFKTKSYQLAYMFGGYRRNFLKNAKKSHQSVTKKMYDKFRKYSNKWLKANATSSDCIDDWLTGEIYANAIKTSRVKENYLKKTPYHVYYKYKTDNSTATGLNSNQTKRKTDPNKKNPPLNNTNINNTTTNSTLDSHQIPSTSNNIASNNETDPLT